MILQRFLIQAGSGCGVSLCFLSKLAVFAKLKNSQVLAKPMGVSELSALIPKELQVRETQLSEALDQVATPGNPSGSYLT